MVRFKNRYMTIEIHPNEWPEGVPLVLKSGSFHDAVINKIQQLHGDFGVAAVRSGFLAKYCNENTRIAILRARHGPHKIVASTLPVITKIGKMNVSIQTLHTGATMKHSFKFIQKYQRAYLDTKWATLKTDEERKQFEAAVMDFTKTDVKIELEKMT